MKVNVFRDSKLWLTAQDPTKPAMWTRVRDAAINGRTVAIRPVAKPPAPPPVPPPPSGVNLEPARNVAFFATVTDDAIQYFCRLPKTWKAAFTADPAYQVTDQQIAAVKASGHRAYSWCDCRTTLPPDAYRMAVTRYLAGWYGQGESADEFDEALKYIRKPTAIVGNLSALTAIQLAKVANADVLFINETYYNVQPNLHPDWRGANNGIGGNCWACYASASEGAVYTPIDARFNKATDSVYTEGMLPADWEYLL